MQQGWIAGLAALTVVRELRFDTTRQKLVSLPVAELASLRTDALANITGRSLSPGQPQLVLAQGAAATAADVEMELSMRPGAAPFSVSVRALGVPVSLACSPASPPTRPVGSCTLFTPGRGRGRKTNRQVSFSVYFYTQIIADVIAHFTGDLSSRRNIYG